VNFRLPREATPAGRIDQSDCPRLRPISLIKTAQSDKFPNPNPVNPVILSKNSSFTGGRQPAK